MIEKNDWAVGKEAVVGIRHFREVRCVDTTGYAGFSAPNLFFARYAAALAEAKRRNGAKGK